MGESEKRNFTKTNWFKRLVEREPLAIVMTLACIAALIVSITTCLREETQSQQEEIRSKLDIAIEKKERFEELVDSEEAGSGGMEDAQDVVKSVGNHIFQAETAFLEDNLTEAIWHILEANNRMDEFIGFTPSSTPFTPGDEVSISAAPFQGFVGIDIDEETTATTKEGEPLTAITVVIGDPPSSAAYSIVLAFDIYPDGAIFDRPITLTFFYIQSNIPKGVHEEDLVVGMWDEDAGGWTILLSLVDLEAHSITTSVTHFTDFAVLAPRTK